MMCRFFWVGVRTAGERKGECEVLGECCVTISASTLEFLLDLLYTPPSHTLLVSWVSVSRELIMVLRGGNCIRDRIQMRLVAMKKPLPC